MLSDAIALGAGIKPVDVVARITTLGAADSFSRATLVNTWKPLDTRAVSLSALSRLHSQVLFSGDYDRQLMIRDNRSDRESVGRSTATSIHLPLPPSISVYLPLLPGTSIYLPPLADRKSVV